MHPAAPIAARLFDDDVIVEEIDPADATEPLTADEARAIERAVEKRKREYVAGRQCARHALRRLGVEGFSLVNDADRAPGWPPGIVGTISHTHGWCAVAVARVGSIRSLGVDVERDIPLKPNLWRSVLTAEETRWIEALPEPERGPAAMVVFSAKECAYKCQYPLSRTFLGFHAMSLTLDPAAGRFRAVFQQDAASAFRAGDVLSGRFLRAQGFLVTAVTLREGA